jgi:SNF2 family DNA or RNA helicase
VKGAVQAMDRAHSIGQTKPEFVLRLCMPEPVEVKLFRRAHSKLALERLVVKKCAASTLIKAGRNGSGNSLFKEAKRNTWPSWRPRIEGTA